MSHIESMERLLASREIRITELEKELSRIKQFYIKKVDKLETSIDCEIKRNDLLIHDLNMADDFITEVCEKYALKYSRKPS